MRDDRLLFEMLNLEGAQAGLSWLTVLKKRDRYREVFDNFDATKIAVYDQGKREELLADAGIIRNKLKVNAAIENAKTYLDITKDGTSFCEYIWNFVDGKPLQRKDREKAEVISHQMSKALLKRGFKFVGPTICYAFMQAVGMINDHEEYCFRATQVAKLSEDARTIR